ncbi:hypothetical protein ACHHYP_11724 [Achlya hypogyna]|uniref:Uncharacterized protein n=1 Tax=Achlya hypogyna TaxID=1202772 RepID=A0A1V9YII3_ACHHY|nr:hypothetical protein ACHHYP_11724 [Achlya hypogyna]
MDCMTLLPAPLADAMRLDAPFADDDCCIIGGSTPLDFAYDGAAAAHAELVARASTIDARCNPTAAVRPGGEATRKNLCISVDDVESDECSTPETNDDRQHPSSMALGDESGADADVCKRKSMEESANEDMSGYVSLAACEEAFHVSKRPKIESVDYSFAFPTEMTSHVQLTAVHNDRARFFFTPYGATSSTSNHLAVQFPFVASGTFEMVGSHHVVAEKTRSTPATPRLVA